MKKNLTLLAFCGLFAASSSAQIIQSVNTEIGIWGTVENTGIAIAPFYHWNAVVYDDPFSGDYWIQWRDAATTNLLDIDNQPGSNPDVAYYANADAVVVAYENGGAVWVDDYYLSTVTPVNYNLNTNNGIAGGLNPNVDMNSRGDGVLTWQDFGGTVWMCTFQIGPFTAGPLVPIASGRMPDVALMDNSRELVLTYEQGGQLVIETYDYFVLQSGAAALTSAPVIMPSSGAGWEWPRVQSNRNRLFGNPDLYTVVAQDNMGGMYDVWGYFFNGAGNMVGASLVNNGVNFCSPSLPRPVVAYDRDEVHVAFAQDHSCAFPPSDPSSEDILMVHYDHAGNNMPVTPPGVFLEVNWFDLPLTYSATSLNTEYDGNYLINNTNYCEGTCFHDPGDLIWKVRDPATPAWRQAEPGKLTVEIDKGVMSNFVTVEVTSLDETITENDIEMEFAVYDQSGRLVTVPTFEKEGMTYRIDVTNLEQGIYLLHYTLNGETKAERIPHFTN